MSKDVSTAQYEAVQRALQSSTRSSLDISEAGSGKTRLAVKLMAALNPRVTLVVAPLQTLPSWKSTVDQYRPGVRFAQITTVKGKKPELDNFLFGVPGVYFIGPAMLNTIGGGAKTTGVLEQAVADMIIRDESHQGSGNRSNASVKNLYRVAGIDRVSQQRKRPVWLHAMSGTPAGNNWTPLHSTALWLFGDPKDRFVDYSISAWKRRWFETEYNNFSYDHLDIVREKLPGAFMSSLPCVIDIPAEEFDVETVDVPVQLSPRERELYNSMEQNMIAWITEQDAVVAELPIVQRIRLRQATLGEFTLGEDDTVEYRADGVSSKLVALRGMLDGECAGEAVLVFTHSARWARHAATVLRGAGVSAESWTGADSQAERERIKARFLSGETRVVVAVIAAAGTGLDGLQKASRNVIFASRADGVIDNEQAVARLARRGQERQVRVWNLLAEGTLDAGVYSEELVRALHLSASRRVDSK